MKIIKEKQEILKYEIGDVVNTHFGYTYLVLPDNAFPSRDKEFDVVVFSLEGNILDAIQSSDINKVYKKCELVLK